MVREMLVHPRPVKIRVCSGIRHSSNVPGNGAGNSASGARRENG